jgi:hypothetical protein
MRNYEKNKKIKLKFEPILSHVDLSMLHAKLTKPWPRLKAQQAEALAEITEMFRDVFRFWLGWPEFICSRVFVDRYEGVASVSFHVSIGTDACGEMMPDTFPVYVFRVRPGTGVVMLVVEEQECVTVRAACAIVERLSNDFMRFWKTKSGQKRLQDVIENASALANAAWAMEAFVKHHTAPATKNAKKGDENA